MITKYIFQNVLYILLQVPIGKVEEEITQFKIGAHVSKNCMVSTLKWFLDNSKYTIEIITHILCWFWYIPSIFQQALALIRSSKEPQIA